MSSVPTPILGSHVSIAGGLFKAIDRAVAAGLDCLQVFTKNASRWQAPPLSDEHVALFRQRRQRSGLKAVVAHASYLINLASPEEEKRQRSIAALIDEMHRCNLLGISQLVVHPGAHRGAGQKQGMATLIDSLGQVFDQAPSEVTVLLENTAGMGTCLGASFELLAEAVFVLARPNIGVCFDTCHAFAAGYDLATKKGYDNVIAELTTMGCLNRIEVIHLNDSQRACGSRVDRHDHPGKGVIGEAGFRRLMRDPHFGDVPKILEVPRGDQGQWEQRNLQYLHQLAKRAV